MGYTTNFKGAFKLDRPLAPEHAAYLKAFNETRRMRRNEFATVDLPDPVRVAAGLPVGQDGAYYVGAPGWMGLDEYNNPAILDYNGPPQGQPGLWCQWKPHPAGTTIAWDGGEKFYNYVEWLEYLIAHFLGPWGYVLNGTVTWAGESPDDRGKIVVKDNVVTIKKGRITYE